MEQNLQIDPARLQAQEDLLARFRAEVDGAWRAVDAAQRQLAAAQRELHSELKRLKRIALKDERNRIAWTDHMSGPFRDRVAAARRALAAVQQQHDDAADKTAMQEQTVRQCRAYASRTPLQPGEA